MQATCRQPGQPHALAGRLRVMAKQPGRDVEVIVGFHGLGGV
jgi:hypothetical protein